MIKRYSKKTLLIGLTTTVLTSGLLSTMLTGEAHSAAASIQALGGWWNAGDSGSTYGLGLRGSLGETWGVDLGWMSYGEGDDISVNNPTNDDKINFGGIKANVFDLGLRYTFPMELYIGGGASYFDFDHDLDSVDGEWGVYGLVGWSFGGEHLRGFIEGMYRYTSGTIKFEEDRFLYSFEEDIDQDGFAANIGVMYRF